MTPRALMVELQLHRAVAALLVLLQVARRPLQGLVQVLAGLAGAVPWLLALAASWGVWLQGLEVGRSLAAGSCS